VPSTTWYDNTLFTDALHGFAASCNACEFTDGRLLCEVGRLPLYTAVAAAMASDAYTHRAADSSSSISNATTASCCHKPAVATTAAKSDPTATAVATTVTATATTNAAGTSGGGAAAQEAISTVAVVGACGCTPAHVTTLFLIGFLKVSCLCCIKLL
jgi:hypothetical protein